MSENPPIIAGTRIGHVHLKVADLDRALGFYCGVLGFELQQRMGSGAGPTRLLYPDSGSLRSFSPQRDSRSIEPQLVSLLFAIYRPFAGIVGEEPGLWGELRLRLGNRHRLSYAAGREE